MLEKKIYHQKVLGRSESAIGLNSRVKTLSRSWGDDDVKIINCVWGLYGELGTQESEMKNP